MNAYANFELDPIIWSEVMLLLKKQRKLNFELKVQRINTKNYTALHWVIRNVYTNFELNPFNFTWVIVSERIYNVKNENSTLSFKFIGSTKKARKLFCGLWICIPTLNLIRSFSAKLQYIIKKNKENSTFNFKCIE